MNAALLGALQNPASAERATGRQFPRTTTSRKTAHFLPPAAGATDTVWRDLVIPRLDEFTRQEIERHATLVLRRDDEPAATRLPLVPKPRANAETCTVDGSAVPAGPQVAFELPEIEKEAAVLAQNVSDVASQPAKPPPLRYANGRHCIVMVRSHNSSSEEEERLSVVTKNLGELRIPFTKVVLGDQKKGLPTHKYHLIVQTKLKDTYPQIFVEDSDTGRHNLFVPNAYVAKMVEIKQERTAGTMAANASVPKKFCVEFVFKDVEKTPSPDRLLVGEPTEMTSVSVQDADAAPTTELKTPTQPQS